MPRDDDEDLYDEEFDFVDDDDLDEEEKEEEPEKKPAPGSRSRERADDDADERGEGEESEEPVDEYGRTEPQANYVVHLYENKKFKRTIERPFTPEDAEAFASEFNRTSKNYSRFAVTGKNDAKPKKSLD
jgi:hypothetical protein